MIVFPNAKINIGLNITEKRIDGYHNIESLFFPIGLKDVLEVIRDDSLNKMELEISGIILDHKKGNNLVEKAWQILHDKYDIGGCRAILHKKIPFGAGLGGGSSDAAFCLKALNALFNLELSNNKLLALAKEIGADCPFFIENKPSLATGIGDKLFPIHISVKGKHLVLVKPNVTVPTKDAYANIFPKKPLVSLSALKHIHANDWKEFVRNDFEPSVFSKYTEVADIKKRLLHEGAMYASMSGSGSAVYGIFERKPKTKFWFPNDYFIWEEEL